MRATAPAPAGRASPPQQSARAAAARPLPSRPRASVPRSSRSLAAAVAAPPAADAEAAVYAALRHVIDPDFGADIVECGFVKDLRVDGVSGRVSFVLELTTPVRAHRAAACSRARRDRARLTARASAAQACPVKEEFDQKIKQYLGELPWVTEARERLAAHAAHAAVSPILAGGREDHSLRFRLHLPRRAPGAWRPWATRGGGHLQRRRG